MSNPHLEAASHLYDDAVSLLSDLIAFESTVGNEGPAMRYIHERMSEVADEVEFVEVTEAIKDDPDYSYPVVTQYGDRPNVRAVRKAPAAASPCCSTRTSTSSRPHRATWTRSRRASKTVSSTVVGPVTPRAR